MKRSRTSSRSPGLLRWFAALLLGVVLAVWVIRQRPPAVEFTDGACEQAYLDLFRASQAGDPIRVKIVFGYKDARPARFVADRYERMLLVQRLLAQCNREDAACAFDRDPDDAELFTKTIFGPDGKKRRVELQVIASSAGPDDVENRANPFQRWTSDHAQQSWIEALQRTEIAFYNGHSRSGGGPDFSPPRINAANHITYPWYREHQPGLKQMRSTLVSEDSRAKVVGMFSCAASPLFADELRKTRNGFGVLSSDRLIYFAEAIDQSLEALSALLKMKCQPEFESLLRAGTQFLGFFDLKKDQ